MIAQEINYEHLKSIIDKYSVYDYNIMMKDIECHILSNGYSEEQFWKEWHDISDILANIVPKYAKIKNYEIEFYNSIKFG
jgi:hypothetical protein